MGFEIKTFVSRVDDAYLCWICKKVLDNPLATPCGHVFCSVCVIRRVVDSRSCPRGCPGRFSLKSLNHVQPFGRLIGKLLVRCLFFDKGCKAVCNLENFKFHSLNCMFNPTKTSFSLRNRKGFGSVHPNIKRHSSVTSGFLPCLTKKAEIRENKNQVNKRKEALRTTQDSHSRKCIELRSNVNGQDLPEVRQALKKSQVLGSATTSSSKVLRQTPTNSIKSLNTSGSSAMKVEGSTQTESHQCFCQYLLQSQKQSLNPLYSRFLSELYGHYQATKVSEQSTTNNTIHCEDKEFTQYEEVILKRPKSGKKLGVILCDFENPATKQTTVVVAEIAAGSRAAKSQKMREGDTVLELFYTDPRSRRPIMRQGFLRRVKSWLFYNHNNHIDGSAVTCMEDAANLLSNQNASIAFLLGRSTNATRPIHDFDHNRIATTHVIEETETSEQRHRSDVTREAETSQVNGRSKSGRSLFYTKKYARSQSMLDKGLNVEHKELTQLKNYARRRSDGNFRPTLTGNGCEYFRSHLKSNDNNLQPPKFSYAKRVSFSKESCEKENRSAEANRLDLDQLNHAAEHVHISPRKPIVSTSTIEDMEAWTAEGISPWVQIARRDYETKLRQLEKGGLQKRQNSPLNEVIEPSTDNTSSAYSTGESFRSSGSADDPNLGRDLISRSQSKLEAFSILHTDYVSSDANSDDEGPACYLTHNEDGSESEGFEDAGKEFRPLFSAANFFSRPIPLSRTLHPTPESSEFKFFPSTSPLKSFGNDKGANFYVHSDRGSPLDNGSGSDKSQFIDQRIFTDRASIKRDGTDFTIPIINVSDWGDSDNQRSSDEEDAPQNSDLLEINRIPVRRKSEHVLPTRRPPPPQRSISCVETREVQGEDLAEASEGVQMEWKVRIRKDGTRYITKRPVREKILRSREKRIAAERSGATTDEDQTEVKQGRHWSKDDRKRQFRVAREKKRRRDFMQRRRLEALKENSPVDGDIAQLCRRKINNSNQKRMLFDDFVTVQEILARSNKADDIKKINPSLSVTYI